MDGSSRNARMVRPAFTMMLGTFASRESWIDPRGAHGGLFRCDEAARCVLTWPTRWRISPA
jgi:hypothetical protein